MPGSKRNGNGNNGKIEITAAEVSIIKRDVHRIKTDIQLIKENMTNVLDFMGEFNENWVPQVVEQIVAQMHEKMESSYKHIVEMHNKDMKKLLCYGIESKTGQPIISSIDANCPINEDEKEMKG